MYESSTKETKWVCIQLACSQRPRALEEAHCWNIQAKFYNEKFPLVYEAQVWQRIVALSLLSFLSLFWAFSFFYGLSLLFLIPHLGQCSRKWWSSHFYLFTTQWLQLDARTKDDSIWMPPAVYRDMQWIKSNIYEKLWAVASPQIRCQLHDHAKKYDNDECVKINRMVESCMAIYLGMAMEMP